MDPHTEEEPKVILLSSHSNHPDPVPVEATSKSASSPASESESKSSLPTPAEIYGLIAVLGTYLAFGIYIIWAFCPSRWLDKVGWTWYPSKSVYKSKVRVNKSKRIHVYKSTPCPVR
jgi:hypothetical protein